MLLNVEVVSNLPKIKDNLKRYWRMLDDQAKIYSLSYNKKDEL